MNDMKEIVLASVREFVSKRIAPIAADIDEKEVFPLEVIRELGQLGYYRIPFDEQYGEAGFSLFMSVIEELAGTCASTAMTVLAHTILATMPMMSACDVLKEQYLAGMLDGRLIGAFALTEADSGSDTASIRTYAEEKEDHFAITGSKIYITNANVADVFIVPVRTSQKPGVLGISLFLVDKTMEGVTVSGKSDKKMGMRGSDTGEVIFRAVKVPRHHLIGRQNLGFKILNSTLIDARMGMAALSTGIAKSALHHSLEYALTRKQFEHPIFHYQMIQNKIADMEMYIDASILLLEKAYTMRKEGGDISKEASEAKLFASETAVRVTKEAIQVFGAYGYSRELPLERYYRDAKLTEIGDGTSEIQKLIIANEAARRFSKLRRYI